MVLARTGWAASASVNSAGALFALDGKKTSTNAWYTGAAQAVGQWFQVDMKTHQTFNKIELNQEFYTSYYPRGYEVLVSNDGVTWSAPVATGMGVSGNTTTISFVSQTARYVRVKLTASATSWWAVTEFYVYAP